MKITKLSDIDYSNISIISFDATIIDIASEGDGEKRPMKFTLKLEDSGELLTVTSWKFDELPIIKEGSKNDNVYEITAQAGTYGSFGEQVRVGSIVTLQRKSARKIVKTVDADAIKREMKTIVDTYIPKGSAIYNIVYRLIFENEKFWIWPAATKIHHAYPGGLAKHSLNVCKNAISIWNTYQGSNCDISTLVAGSLLHDIGKIQEYNQDGSRTVYGNLIPHPISGYERVARAALELNLDPEKDTRVIMLEHCILSHHEKLEYGAAVQPGILEACIIAKADGLDAVYESADKALDNLEKNGTSDRLMTLDGSKVFKWHE